MTQPRASSASFWSEASCRDELPTSEPAGRTDNSAALTAAPLNATMALVRRCRARTERREALCGVYRDVFADDIERRAAARG
jgi:hypothetical protein